LGRRGRRSHYYANSWVRSFLEVVGGSEHPLSSAGLCIAYLLHTPAASHTTQSDLERYPPLTSLGKGELDHLLLFSLFRCKHVIYVPSLENSVSFFFSRI
jgi:hypothetical protein